jgi:PPM family protein phosphatase
MKMFVQGKVESFGYVDPQNGNSLAPAAVTDPGCERELNEDRYGVIECDSGTAWIVCDGMGGVSGGELAAQIAMDAVRRTLTSSGGLSADQAVELALREANRLVVLRRQNQAFSSMGTTAVFALFQGSEVVISHVGDSRAYLVRSGVIQQLTVDHTYVQNLVDQGDINLEEALSHPDAHILTRCLGSQAGLELDILKFWVWPVKEGAVKDYLVLVTDGLYTMIDDQEIARVVSSESPQAACVKLTEEAKRKGGYDNITIAIIPLNGQLRSDIPPNYKPTHKFNNGVADSTGMATSASIWMMVSLGLVAIFLLVVILIMLFFGPQLGL